MNEVKDVMYRIKNINYDVVDVDLENDIKVNATYKDFVENIYFNKTNDIVHILVARNVQFEPEVLFNLKVVLEFRVEISDEYLNKISLEAIENNLAELVGQTSAMPRLSNLIANITSAQNNAPIITDPMLTL